MESLQADARRADWEEGHSCSIGYAWGLERWFLMGEDALERRFKTRREAIDAAMEAAEQKA